MSVIVGFVILLMLLFLIYMLLRFLAERKMYLLLPLCLQILVFTMAVLCFFQDIKILGSTFLELLYILIGIIVPLFFIFMDFRKLAHRFKKMGIILSLSEVWNIDRAGGKADLNQEIEPPAADRTMGEIAGEIEAFMPGFKSGLMMCLSRAGAMALKGDINGALGVYEALIRLVNSSPRLFYNYGNLNYRVKRYREAYDSYRRAIELLDRQKSEEGPDVSPPSEETPDKLEDKDNFYAAVCYNMGNALYGLRRFDRAVDWYEKAERDPGMARQAAKNIIISLLNLSRYSEAEKRCRYLISLNEASSWPWFVLGKILTESGRPEEAQEALEQCIRLDPRSREAYLLLGSLYYKSNSFDRAISAYENAARLDPADSSVMYTLGTALFRGGKMEKAVRAFRDVVELEPDNYKAYYNMAVALDQLGRQHEAARAFEKVIELKPDFPDAYNNLGILLSIMGRYEEALKVYEKGIKVDPDAHGIYFNMGVTCYEMGRFADAVKAYRKSLSICPDTRDVYCHLGAALVRLRLYDEAVKVYKKALSVHVSDSELFYNISTVYALLNMKDTALENLKKAIELDVNLKAEARNNKAFERIRTMPEFRELVS